ncbi:MAG: FG-GAP repeat protein, partial [Arenicella sp.]|nr:FG-GAP repeat protein [Arenicella sp.]
TIHTIYGDSAYDEFGRSIDGVGDINADGIPDFIVGAPFDDNNGISSSGSVKLISGIDWSILHMFDGDAANDPFGSSVSNAGDVDGDGTNDIIVGFPGSDYNGDNSGGARVFSGATMGVLYTFYGASEGDSFGRSVSSAGDVNNDGFDDLIIGATGDDHNGYDFGSATIFSGSDGSKLYTFYGSQEDSGFGHSVGSLGDLNGNGGSEVVVGARGEGSTVIVYSLLSDWDFDGYDNLEDPAPLIFTDDTTDIDGDGLSDLYEFANGLDPFDSDTDNDGLSDGDEVNIYFTDPKSADSDGDNIPDFIEVGYALDPNDNADASLDLDQDGLSNILEYELGSLLDNQDSDGDTLLDGLEYANIGRTHPTLSDTDGDTLTDELDIDNDWYYFYNGGIYAKQSTIGTTVSGAGDINADGYPDIIIGAPSSDPQNGEHGSATILSGLDGSILYFIEGNETDTQFGYSVSDAGDVNNDGVADVIIGSPDDVKNGTASVYSGLNGSVLYTFSGFDSSFGSAVSSAGDVNNDGFDDLIVGARYDNTNNFKAGSVYVYSGFDGSTLYTISGDSSYDSLGTAVSSVGDVNNDDHDDFIIGLPLDDVYGSNSGTVRVYSGANGSVLYERYGGRSQAQLGAAVSGAGDINNDGVPDFIAGSPRDSNNGSDSGSARAYSGSDGTLLFQMLGDAAGDYFGSSVSGIGDANGDGYADLVIGAPQTYLSANGYAKVISGLDGRALHLVHGDSLYDKLGTSVSGVGDIDQDGYTEIIVGAPEDDNNGSDSGSVRVYSIATQDYDGDGLTTLIDPAPINYTDATTDIDADGLTDFYEIDNGFDIFDPDMDNDGLIDGDEVNIYNSSPLLSDTDGDQIPDFDEVSFGMDPADPNDISLDIDGDGLSNGFEFAYGTLVDNIDTDGDTISDGEEYNHIARSHPLLADTDDDGIQDNLDTDNEWVYYFHGNSRDHRVGGSVSGAGDVNADGYPDIIVGAENDQTNGPNSGSAHIISGLDGAVLFNFYGDSGEYFGSSVSGAGDTNGDGYADVVVGVFNDDTNGNGSGAARVFSGIDGSILYTFNGDAANDRFGRSVSTAGDVNNDGYADIIVGAHL